MFGNYPQISQIREKIGEICVISGYFWHFNQHDNTAFSWGRQLLASFIQAKASQVEAAILNVKILKIEPERGRIWLGWIEQ